MPDKVSASEFVKACLFVLQPCSEERELFKPEPLQEPPSDEALLAVLKIHSEMNIGVSFPQSHET